MIKWDEKSGLKTIIQNLSISKAFNGIDIQWWNLCLLDHLQTESRWQDVRLEKSRLPMRHFLEVRPYYNISKTTWSMTIWHYDSALQYISIAPRASPFINLWTPTTNTTHTSTHPPHESLPAKPGNLEQPWQLALDANSTHQRLEYSSRYMKCDKRETWSQNSRTCNLPDSKLDTLTTSCWSFASTLPPKTNRCPCKNCYILMFSHLLFQVTCCSLTQNVVLCSSGNSSKSNPRGHHLPLWFVALPAKCPKTWSSFASWHLNIAGALECLIFMILQNISRWKSPKKRM